MWAEGWTTEEAPFGDARPRDYGVSTTTEGRTMRMTDEDLAKAATALESETVERTASFKGDVPNAIREAICAFANDLAGHGRPGIAFIGLADDGTPSGLAVTDELLRQLADIKTDGNIVPPPSLSVEKRQVAGADVAVVTVLPADTPPVRYKGRIWVRVGPRRGIATAQDERILNERRRHKDRPYDVAPVPSATLADLDVRRFEYEYLPAAVAPDILEANGRTQEERLAALKMIRSSEDRTPTVLGLLMLGRHPRSFLPGAYVQFLRVQGTTLADPVIDELLIDGPMSEVVSRLDGKLEAFNRVAVEYAHIPLERRTATYPAIALREVVRNALLHRTYEHTNSPVRVTWYDDRVDVYSPGGPFGEVTAENFGEPYITGYRNPDLAESMHVLRIVQRFGSGLALAREAMRKNGNPPLEWKVSPQSVLVTLRRE